MPLFSLRRRSRAGIGVLAFSVWLGACGRGSSAASEIGIAVALNPQRAGMQTIYNGVELAITALNDEGKARLNGRHFVMVRGPDTLIDPIKIADFLRVDPRVVGVVGHPESGTTLNAIDEYADTRNGERNAVVAISPTGTSPALRGANRWLFRVCPSDIQSSRAVAQYLLDSLGARRASIIYRNDAYGKDWAASFTDAYRRGRGVVVERDPYLQGATAWDAYAGYLQMLKPDVLLFPGSQEDALLALRAMRSAGVTIPLIGGDATSGLEANAAEFPTVRYVSFFLARTATTPEAVKFIEEYRTRFKSEPDQRAALAYDAAMLIGRGAIEVGPDRPKIRDYVESIGSTRKAMLGVAGPIEFDAQHDAVNKPIVIARVGK